MIMKTILSTLVALSVIAGIAGTGNALDAKTFWEQIDRDHNSPVVRRLLVDTSKGHRRQWCSMKNCGNREKQRR